MWDLRALDLIDMHTEEVAYLCCDFSAKVRLELDRMPVALLLHGARLTGSLRPACVVCVPCDALALGQQQVLSCCQCMAWQLCWAQISRHQLPHDPGL